MWRKMMDADLAKDEIRKSLEFDPDALVDRAYETMLYDHYTRPKYWE